MLLAPDRVNETGHDNRERKPPLDAPRKPVEISSFLPPWGYLTITC
jgi:hypothetical protein